MATNFGVQTSPDGGISLSVRVDTSEGIRDLKRLDAEAERTAKAIVKLDGQKVSVKPDGVRDLGAAGREAEKLGKSLDGAGRAARGVQAPNIGGGLAKSAAAAAGLEDSLEGARGAADKLGHSSGPAQMGASLTGLASAAKGLLPALSATAAAGTIISKGWSRLTSIDTAQAKLRGLGNDAQAVEQIMADANKAVSGTAFGLADAVTTASTMVAAGLKPGAELSQVLTTVADSAAIAGVSMGEMGSIFNKVLTGDSIMAEELNQLGDRGLPIIQMLADQMGVASSSVKKLASEGAIDFATFNAAMESSLGGSAQAMGQSLLGTLDNVGAAMGRLGAAGLAPFMGPIQSGAGALTGVLNGLTSTVTKLSGVWERIPGPIQSVVGAFGAAAVGAKALQSDMGEKLTGKIKEFVTALLSSDGAVRTWGRSVAESYRTAAASHKKAAAEARASAWLMGSAWGAAEQRTIALGHSITGVMAGAKVAVKAGVGSIVAALGGPLMIGLAAATWAIGNMARQSQKLAEVSAVAEEMRKATLGLGKDVAGELLAGDIQGAVDVYVGAYSTLLEKQQELADSNPDTFWAKLGGSMRAMWEQINVFSEADFSSMANEFHALVDASEDAKEVSEHLKSAGIGAEELAAAVTGSDAAFQGMQARLQAMGGETSGLQLQLNASRQEFLALNRATEGAVGTSAEVAAGFAQIRDEASSADKQVDGLVSTLQKLAGFDLSLDEATRSFRENINDLLSEASPFDAAGGLGSSLLTEDGTLNYQLDNAIALQEQLLGLQEDYAALVHAGGNATEAWETGVSPALDRLASAAGLSRDEINGLADAIGLVPGQTEVTLAVATSEALGGVRDLWAAIQDGRAKVGEPVTLKVDNVDEARLNFEALGIEVENVNRTASTITVGVDSEEALGHIETVALAMAEIESEKGITISSNASGELDMLEALGVKVLQLPSGDYRIDSNSLAEIDNLVRLGVLVRDPKTGSVHINSNLADVVAKGKELDARNGKQTAETHTIRRIMEERRISYWESQGYSREQAATIQGPPNWALGGLVGYASGGMPEGRILPTTGPGTNVTDGIVGVSEDGTPIARVDAGEFITRRSATEKWEALLWAINADDEAGIYAAATAGLKGYATGGRPGMPQPSTPAAQAGGAAQPGGATPTPTGEGDLGLLVAQLGALGAPTTVIVEADSTQAEEELAEVTGQVEALPDGSLEVAADTAPAVEAIDALGETTPPPLVLDTTLAADSVGQVATQLAELGELEAAPQIGLSTEPLQEQAEEATEQLGELREQRPIPEAGLNHAALDAGVDESMSQLHMVGAAKATSVSDVDNSSALANIQGVISELNRMPVERVIKVVAIGSTGGLATGGEVPGLAVGGTIAGSTLPTTGPGTGQVDGFLGIDGQGMPLVRVDAGEYVTNRKATAKYRRELELINAGKFPKLDNLDALAAGARMAPGLARGGVVSPAQLLGFASGQTVNGQTAPGSLEGSPYVWGGGLFGNWGDCSGAMSGLAAVALGLNASGRKFATMNEGAWLLANGARPGLGPTATSFNIGWFNGGPWGGHTSGTIAGTNVEMGGGRGNGQIGGAAAGAGHPQYTDHAHITLGELVAIDKFVPLAGVSASRVPAGSGGMSASGGHGVSLGGAGVTLHDNGGWLQPGGIAVNHLSQPEPVLTPAHWGLVEQLIAVFPQHADAIRSAGEAIDNAAGSLRATAEALRDPNSDQSIMLRALGGEAMETIDLLGLDGLADSLGELTGAEKMIREYRDGQAERATAIAEAERELAAAREASEAATKAEAEGVAVEDSTKVKDAEKQLAEAKAGTDGKVDADKVAQAEKALADARTAATEDAAKNEQKRKDDAEKAAGDIVKAEEKLAKARKESIAGLDTPLYTVFPQLHDALRTAQGSVAGLATRLAASGGAGAQAAGILSALSGTLGGVAAAAGPAGISIGGMITAIKAAIKVARLIGKLIDNVADMRAAEAEAIASGASMMTDSIGTLADTLAAAAKIADDFTAAQLRQIGAQAELQGAQESLAEARRKQSTDRAEDYRRVQQAEWDLAQARHDASQVAGAAEVNLSEVRKDGIFKVTATATAADRAAIQAASDVATREAALAQARAQLAQNDFENQLQVTKATTAMERAQWQATVEMRKLTAASEALARAQAAATGSLSGAQALEKFLEGQAMVAEGRGKIVAGQGKMDAWFSKWSSKHAEGRALRAEGQTRVAQGQAMMNAYRDEMLKELKGLTPEVRAEVERTLAQVQGIRGGSLGSKIVDFFNGGGKATSAEMQARYTEAMYRLNSLIFESQYKTEAAAMSAQKEQDRLEREEKAQELEWKTSDLADQIASWDQRDYLAETQALTAQILAEHQQENKQLGEMNDKLTPKNTSVLMSIGGAGWGAAGASTGAGRAGGFGGITQADMSLWDSARVEDAWIDAEVRRMMTPALDSVGDAMAAGARTWAENLPDTVVEGYYRPSEEALAQARQSLGGAASDAAIQSAVKQIVDAIGSRPTAQPVGTQFTGPVTVQSTQADKLAAGLEQALARA